MRRVLLAAAVALSTAAFIPGAALADTCLSSVTATGKWLPDRRDAQRSAYGAWQHKVRCDHGAKFADYWYSASRAVSCVWKDHHGGYLYKSTVSARPCARN